MDDARKINHFNPFLCNTSTEPGDHVVCGCVRDYCAPGNIEVGLHSAFAATVVEADTHNVICASLGYSDSWTRSIDNPLHGWGR